MDKELRTSNASPSDTYQKDRLIQELKQKVSVLQEKFQTEDDEERQWMIQRCDNPRIIGLLNEMTVMMLHVVDAVGRLEPVNGITISKQFGIPKGSVSKITKRLVEKQILRMENRPDNKKEILFSLTPAGKEIFELHHALHKQMDIGISHFLQRYSAEELRFLNRSMQDTIHASWVNFEGIEDGIIVQGEGEVHAQHITSGSSNGKNLSASADQADAMARITEMLRTLDSRDLKKAEAILKDVFFTSFDE